VSETGTWIWKQVSSLGTWLGSKITDLGAWIIGQVGPFFNNLLKNLSTVSSYIGGKLSEGWSWISSRLSEGWAYLTGKISETGTWIKGGLDGLGSWLNNNVAKPISQFPAQVGNILGGTVNNLISGILKPLQDLWTWLVNGVTGVASTIAGFGTQAAHVIGNIFSPFLKTMVDGLTHSFSPGSPDPELNRSVGVWYDSMMLNLEETAITAYGSPADLPKMPGVAAGAAVATSVAALIAQGVSAAFDAVHPIKHLGIAEVCREMLHMVGLGTVSAGPLIAMYEAGIMRPLRYYYNVTFAPWIPDTVLMAQMLTQRLISGQTYTETLRMHGFSSDWAMLMLQTSYRAPQFGDLKQMAWRGVLGPEKIAEALRFQSIREDYIAPFQALLENIPGPADLIRFVIREVIAPGDFTAQMRRQGYSTEWAGAFWDAHWRDLDEARIHEAYHRGLISREERDRFLILIDFRPTARPGIASSDLSIVGGLAKTLIPRVDLRYAWEMGSLTREELVDRYQKLGYEDDAELMAEIQIARAMEAEAGKVRDEWVQDFIAGFSSEETLRANLAAVGQGPERIEYYVAYALKRRDRDHKKALLALYADSNAKDLMTDAELEGAASAILADPDALSLFTEKAYVVKYKKPKAGA
jgi:hypothetical protein